uniref:Secreted protein n=1 Tax=Molossus molossus TaxID=27622 RepID=A0A7J8JWF5_MOLMO|nr:hypothetical protein HJG59_008069 [Molossus molossus]
MGKRCSAACPRWLMWLAADLRLGSCTWPLHVARASHRLVAGFRSGTVQEIPMDAAKLLSIQPWRSRCIRLPVALQDSQTEGRRRQGPLGTIFGDKLPQSPSFPSLGYLRSIRSQLQREEKSEDNACI